MSQVTDATMMENMNTRFASERITHEHEVIRLEDLINEDSKEMLTKELIMQKTSPNRLGTKF